MSIRTRLRYYAVNSEKEDSFDVNPEEKFIFSDGHGIAKQGSYRGDPETGGGGGGPLPSVRAG